MKEQEYINVSDLAKIKAAKAILADITPANSAIIGASGMSDILNQLTKWEQRLYETVELTS